METVHVGVRQKSDGAIAHVCQLKVAADPGAQGSYNCLHFGVGERLRQGGAFRVEDFSAQGQDGVVATVAALLAGAAGGVALDNVKDGLLERRAAADVGQLAGQFRYFQGRLANDQLAGGSGRLAAALRAAE